jgi:hypothetical protein
MFNISWICEYLDFSRYSYYNCIKNKEKVKLKEYKFKLLIKVVLEKSGGRILCTN